MTPDQLPLPLPPAVTHGWDDYLEGPANAEAVAALRAWAAWPGRRLVLVAPPRAGKTHLAGLWAAEARARTVGAADLAALDIGALGGVPMLVEDIDRMGPDAAATERALFHLHNHLGATGAALLMTSGMAPAHLPIGLPDLASRLGACAVARIGPPDDALLSSILIKHLADRGVIVKAPVLDRLVRRIERSYQAVDDLAAVLDGLSLARKRRVTKEMVKGLLRTGDGQS